MSGAPSPRTILVAGAAGALGRRVASALAGRGDKVIATFRTERPAAVEALRDAGCETLRLDLGDHERAADAIGRADAAILTPILTVSGPAARAALGRGWRGRLVLFSSNNVAIDQASPVYAALRAEEAAVLAAAGAAGGDAVVVRPTMIYGHPEDGNLSRLIRLAHAWPALPLPGSGKALQQPIHVDDLATLTVTLADAAAGESVVAAAGPEPLPLKALYEAAAQAAGRRRPVVSVPLAPLIVLAGAAEALSLPFPYESAQLARMGLDKTPVGPAPAGWWPQIALADGLARLARDVGLPSRPA